MSAPLKLQRGIQLGLLVLLAVMPFHAFFSVWLGSLTHHQAIIQAWKEVLLAGLSLAAVMLVWLDRSRLERLRQPWVYVAAAFIGLGLLVTALATPGLAAAIFGLKTDYEFLVAGLIATLVGSKAFVAQATKVVLIGAALVAGFDVLQITVLPPDFLTHFGYGPNTIMPYQHITAGTSALRFPATLGGPNQLGTYLILPLCLTTALWIRRPRWWLAALFMASLISLVWTFSRSAWIGAAAAVFMTAAATVPPAWRRRVALGSGFAIVAAAILVPIALDHDSPLQYFILHSSIENHDQANLSDAQHASSLQYGIQAVVQDPFGHGLGTAGPSTFHVGVANIIENYYLQLGYELGWLGIIGFGGLLFTLLRRLLRAAGHLASAIPVAATICGISLVAFVLPAWVDSTTALVVWISAGAIAGANHV